MDITVVVLVVVSAGIIVPGTGVSLHVAVLRVSLGFKSV